MYKQNIHENWTLQIEGESEKVPAKVPGSVYSDLLENKKMPDPFWRDNEDRALGLMENDFIYETTFTPDIELLGCENVLLQCQGLDTIAEVYLNGELVGSADNMHRIWEFPVSGKIRAGANSLRVYFHSPTKFIRERFAECVTLGSEHSLDGFPQIRKPHCMFGWDWGPRLPDAGIWKRISLAGFDQCRLDSVYVTQEHVKDAVRLHFHVEVESPNTEFQYSVSITAPDGSRTTVWDSPDTVTIGNPHLWWPNGFGEQNLYGVKVVLYTEKEEDAGIDTAEKGVKNTDWTGPHYMEADCWEKRIGLRTMTISRKKDEYGESFAHEVNGVCIFAMGADYIPEDNLFGRITRERTRDLLLQCKRANFNCIRVWGGGYYPHDYFYDLCDELGFIVWQDLMFACAVYELTEEFDANIRSEIKDNVRRLRHHASLGLWCGNNEMEMFVDEGTWVNTLKQKADYIKMYEYIIPQVLKKEDPQTYYWPASPSSGGSFDIPNDPNRGDVHYWEVWHGNKPFSEYRKHYFRYASEFGFQSFPCKKTIESYTLPEDRNIFSYVMEKHQRNDAANGKIMNYMYQTFLYPTDFDTLLYASQLLQGEAIKYGVEHFRRNRGRCMGAVYWQLNDCWPAASWSSIDYYGRWKALHYYAKRFFAPLLLSCQEEGVLTQNTNVNAQPFHLDKSVSFNVSNETMEGHKVQIVWAVRKNTGEVIREEREQLYVPALSSVWTGKIEVPQLLVRQEYVSFDLYENEKWISGSTVILSLPKFFHYVNPKLKVLAVGEELLVKTEAYAKSIEIQNENEDLILEDNYFDMNEGERRIRVLQGDISKLYVRSVYDIR